jgi:hypothetical protein
MVPCNSIGYFSLVLVSLYPYCYVTLFTFGFFRFYLSAMLSLPPASLSEHRPSLFSSDPPPCYMVTLCFIF